MTDHLVAFEYGTGQIWGYIRARSTADIATVVPEVDVYDTPPVWMVEEKIRSLRDRVVYVSDGALEAILHQRTPAV